MKNYSKRLSSKAICNSSSSSRRSCPNRDALIAASMAAWNSSSICRTIGSFLCMRTRSSLHKLQRQPGPSPSQIQCALSRVSLCATQRTSCIVFPHTTHFVGSILGMAQRRSLLTQEPTQTASASARCTSASLKHIVQNYMEWYIC
jgi:hypothetical protein